MHRVALHRSLLESHSKSIIVFNVSLLLLAWLGRRRGRFLVKLDREVLLLVCAGFYGFLSR